MIALHTLYEITLFLVDKGFSDRDVLNPAIEVGYKYTKHKLLLI
jgi:hypothetical protein